MIMNDEVVEMDDIYSIRRKGHKVYIGDRVRAIRVNTADGKDYFYRKDGTYYMDHAGAADVGEYERIQTTFPEYTADLQTEAEETLEQLAELIDTLIDSEAEDNEEYPAEVNQETEMV